MLDGHAVCTRLQQGLHERGPAVAGAVVQRAVALVVLCTRAISILSRASGLCATCIETWLLSEDLSSAPAFSRGCTSLASAVVQRAVALVVLHACSYQNSVQGIRIPACVEAWLLLESLAV